MRLKRSQTFYKLKHELADVAQVRVKVGQVWYMVARIAYAHGTIMEPGKPEYFTFAENCISFYPKPDKAYYVIIKALKVVNL